jgi:two-component system, sensor histidine kinase and response regulator
MDMQMPVMDGIAATLELRRMEQHRSLPIIALTANGIVRERQKCMEAGMNDLLATPIEPQEMWDMLQKWIKPPSAAKRPTNWRIKFAKIRMGHKPGRPPAFRR